MTGIYDFHEGTTPLLISVPHDGRMIPDDIAATMTPAGLAIPDTDWHVAKLYDFARDLGASILVARFSRYVVDLNRPRTGESLYPGQVTTGLCAAQTFAGDDIYTSGHVTGDEEQRRIAEYWQPYHDRIERELAGLRERFGHALLWDAHSIASVVPRLFDGELPALNIGTNDGKSCAANIAAAVANAAAASPHSSVVNGRFKGGYITRHYGDPANNVHAVQLEIAQRTYMDEISGAYDAGRATILRGTLRSMLAEFLSAAEK